MVDDMGFSDIGAFGGEIETPTLDGLAANGIRFMQFQNAAKCFPSRAALLTGRYAQNVGMAEKPGSFTTSATIATALKREGYRTFWAGKHHGTDNPVSLGFDRYRGLRDGASNHFNPGSARPGEMPPAKKRDHRTFCFDDVCAASFTPADERYYSTDTYTDWALEYLDEAATGDAPFFLYLAYQAPHDPLQAWPEDIAKYEGRYAVGYEAIAAGRREKLASLGLLADAYPEARPTHRAWSSLSAAEQDEEAQRMAVYAAMIDRVDQNIARVLSRLRDHGLLDNTVIFFMSDNGASAERVFAGPDGEVLTVLYEDQDDEADLLRREGEEIGEPAPIGSIGRWASLGEDWANVSNTPFRLFKNYSHAGGIVTPLIVHWPEGLVGSGRIDDSAGHFIDVMPTVLQLAGAPRTENTDGISLAPIFEGDRIERPAPLFWWWADGKAVREGRWKLVTRGGDSPWELYDTRRDRTETQDLAGEYPEVVERLSRAWTAWAASTQSRSGDSER